MTDDTARSWHIFETYEAEINAYTPCLVNNGEYNNLWILINIAIVNILACAATTCSSGEYITTACDGSGTSDDLGCTGTFYFSHIAIKFLSIFGSQWEYWKN